VFDNEHSLHLWKRHLCTSTAWIQLTDWRVQVTTWRDLRGLLYSHSDIACLLIHSNCIELQPSINILIWVAWLLDHPNIWWRIQIMKLLIMQCSSASCHILCDDNSIDDGDDRTQSLGTTVSNKPINITSYWEWWYMGMKYWQPKTEARVERTSPLLRRYKSPRSWTRASTVRLSSPQTLHGSGRSPFNVPISSKGSYGGQTAW
jgi:hypothetical protein